jgi:hypothetical protein
MIAQVTAYVRKYVFSMINLIQCFKEKVRKREKGMKGTKTRKKNMKDEI